MSAAVIRRSPRPAHTTSMRGAASVAPIDGRERRPRWQEMLACVRSNRTDTAAERAGNPARRARRRWNDAVRQHWFGARRRLRCAPRLTVGVGIMRHTRQRQQMVHPAPTAAASLRPSDHHPAALRVRRSC